MQQPILGRHYKDDDGNPTGGITQGIGITINWQDGPLGRGPGRTEQNGAFVEGIIAAAIDRIEFYQGSDFNCSENNEALDHLRSAISILKRRTEDREKRGVEGTHAI